jgi:hypothetical protein
MSRKFSPRMVRDKSLNGFEQFGAAGAGVLKRWRGGCLQGRIVLKEDTRTLTKLGECVKLSR